MRQPVGMTMGREGMGASRYYGQPGMGGGPPAGAPPVDPLRWEMIQRMMGQGGPQGYMG